MTLVETLRRPVPVAVTVIAALTLLAWAVLFAEAISRGGGYSAFMEALCAPADIVGAGSITEILWRLGLSIGVWIAMSVAMMLPTASLLVVGFADRIEAQGGSAARGSAALWLAAGYLTVWIVISVVAATAQTFIAAFFAAMVLPPATVSILGGLALGVAGFYQFSGLKKACLIMLRHPFETKPESVALDDRSAFRLGLRQGVLCVACCGALMLMLVILGAMNLVWMALLAVVMAAEKMSDSERFPQVVGVVLVALGALLSLSAVGGEAIFMRLFA